jgi:hypothetical protein
MAWFSFVALERRTVSDLTRRLYTTSKLLYGMRSIGYQDLSTRTRNQEYYLRQRYSTLDTILKYRQRLDQELRQQPVS